jgi:hypothetical protein
MAEASEGNLFSEEYEREMEQWLRKRFGLLLGALIAYELIALVAAIGGLLFFRLAKDDDLAGIVQGDAEATQAMAAARADGPAFLSLVIVGTILILAITARAFATVRPRLETREQTLRATNWLILQIGGISFAFELAKQLLFPDMEDLGGGAGSGLTSILFFHLLPSVFLPWTPRESLRPMYPLVSMFLLEMIILKIAGLVGLPNVAAALCCIPLVLLPGLAVSWYRLRTHRRRFDRKMVTKGFFAMRRELSQAKAVQMALFPRPVHGGGLDFDFAYLPANEVGGDFIHASIDERGRLDVVLMDVTGHGLASALTVARLSGEVERLLAEDPDISPGAVLRALNRYVALTLSKHSVYLTAISVQVDPAHGVVRYVNAGHPPAWVRRGDGRVERFDSTTFLLGAVPDADFESDETEIVLGPDDVLVLLTDGVHEAPDRAGRQFGLERIAEHLRRPVGKDGHARGLAAAVGAWRGGMGDDDVLVATVRTPLATPPLPHTASQAEDIERDTALGLGASPAGEPVPATGVRA